MTGVLRDDSPLGFGHPVAPLRTSELARLLDESGDVTLLSSPDGFIVYASAGCRSMTGWEPAELVGRRIGDVLHPDDRWGFAGVRQAVTSSMSLLMATCRLRCRDGSYLWTESALRQVTNPRMPLRPAAGQSNWKGRERLILMTVRDVTDRKLLEDQLERRALSDPLTGVANRGVFMDRLGHALRRLERIPSVVAVIYLDLDHFKVVNDSLGHALGDRLLMAVTERALSSLRSADTLARIGGDEFAILAEDLTGVGEATALAQRVCAGIERPIDLDGQAIVCTASAGIAATSGVGSSPLELLQEADLALYRAKDRGGNRTEVFDEDLRITAIGRLATARMIRGAIDDDRLRIHYQPIIDLATGEVVSAEALLRIEGGDRLILPAEFLAEAEQTGLLVKIDEWLMSEVITQRRIWASHPTFPHLCGINVNVSRRQLSNSSFVQVVASALAEHDLPPEALILEVTERVLMEASPSAMDCLEAVRALGVAVGLDDFGTGSSSLSCLRQFPLDFIKIDQSFIQRLDLSFPDLAIVTAIIDVAHALELTVIAEGVENDVQLRTLTALGCDRAQGLLLGQPDDPGALVAVMDKRRAQAKAALGDAQR